MNAGANQCVASNGRQPSGSVGFRASAAAASRGSRLSLAIMKRRWPVLILIAAGLLGLFLFQLTKVPQSPQSFFWDIRIRTEPRSRASESRMATAGR